MRTITSGERAQLASAHSNFYLRVETKDSSNTYRDLTALGGIDYIDSATWTSSIDNALMTGTILLRREVGANSTSPFLGASPLNSPGPLLDVGRMVRISTAVTAHGVAPAGGDWKEMFLGYITDLDLTADPMSLSIADLGSHLIDAQIEDVLPYGDAAGTPVQDVMQKLLDDNMGAGVYTLYVPDVPGLQNWALYAYNQEKGSLLGALRTIADQIGFDVRYVYDASNVFRLTLFELDRAKTVSDTTIGPDEYLDVRRLAISNADIRNVGRAYWQDKTSLVVTFATSSAPGSIAEFGRRYIEFSYGATNNIDSQVEAQRMIDAAILDLSEPLADQEIEQFYFWPVQLGDLLTYSANGVHYDADQQFGVISYTHTLSASSHRTSISVRGHVAGKYKDWLTKRGGEFPGELLSGPAPLIFTPLGELNAFEDPARDGMIWQQVRFDAATKFIDLYAMESVGPNVPIPELSAIRLSYHLQRQDGDQWSGDNVQFIVGIATRANYWRKVCAIGIGSSGERGPMIVNEVQAVDVGSPPSAPPGATTTAPSGNGKVITWTNGDSSAYTILFRNGIGIVLAPGVTSFYDSNIQVDIAHSYQVCHWKNGQTSGFSGTGVVTVPPTGGTPDPVSAAVAPSWTGLYPYGSGINAANFAWTSDAATTEITIETNPFVLVSVWSPLLTFTDVIHVPTGSATSLALVAGTRLQARIRALVNGVYLYSTVATFTVGTPPLQAPVFVNGTPQRVNTGTIFSPVYHVHVEWTLSDPTATCYSIDILGATNAAYGGGFATPTLLHTVTGGFLTSGSYDITTASIAAVQLRANYTGGVSKSGPLIQVAP